MTAMEKHLVRPFIFTFVVLFTFTGCIYTTFVFVLILLILLAALRIPPTSPEVDPLAFITGRDGGAPALIAHRGGALNAPENTLAAVRQAIVNGARAIEFDVSYTKDGYAVVFHDKSLERCTDGTGLLADKTLEQLRGLNASCKHPLSDKFPNERIPTVEEMVQLCVNNDLHIVLDFKSNPSKTTELVADMFGRYPKLYKLAIVSSFNPIILHSVRRRDRQIACALIHRDDALTTHDYALPWFVRNVLGASLNVFVRWSHFSWLWYLCGTSLILIHHTDVSRSVVDHFTARGVQVVPWTVNNKLDRLYFQQTLHCPVITDNPTDAVLVSKQ